MKSFNCAHICKLFSHIFYTLITQLTTRDHLKILNFDFQSTYVQILMRNEYIYNGVHLQVFIYRKRGGLFSFFSKSLYLSFFIQSFFISKFFFAEVLPFLEFFYHLKKFCNFFKKFFWFFWFFFLNCSFLIFILKFFMILHFFFQNFFTSTFFSFQKKFSFLGL